MTIDSGTVLAGGALLVGGIVWLVRLEGRQNMSDARYVDLKADLSEIKLDLKALLMKPVKSRSSD